MPLPLATAPTGRLPREVNRVLHVVAAAAAGPEEVDDLVEAQLQPGLCAPGLERLRCQLPLLLLQREDALLDGAAHGQAVDDYVDRLREAVDAVDGLFLDELAMLVTDRGMEGGGTNWVPEGL